MGGKAFSDKHEVCRLSTDEYEKIIHTIITRYNWHAVKSIPYYRSKETHGDLDLIISSELYNTIKKKKDLILGAGLTIIDYKENGSVTSFLVELSEDRKFQIDLISTPEEEMEFALFYFGYNDLGNLMGRVARATGLKLGHNGLWYTQRSKTNDSIILKEHLLTRDPNRVLKHLDFDVDQYLAGFDTLEDIFEFVVKSKYYSFDNFDPTQRNHRARIRDAKRPTYTKFLEWAKDKQSNKKPTRWRLLYDYHCREFPHLLFDMIIEEKKDEIRQELASKVNGDIIMGLTGLEGKELGQFIRTFRAKYDDDLLLKMSQYDIYDKITIHYKESEFY